MDTHYFIWLVPFLCITNPFRILMNCLTDLLVESPGMERTVENSTFKATLNFR